jgi:hypothetical protein
MSNEEKAQSPDYSKSNRNSQTSEKTSKTTQRFKTIQVGEYVKGYSFVLSLHYHKTCC